MPPYGAFDLEEWSRKLSLTDANDDPERCVFSDSPISIVAVEHYRRLAGAEFTLHDGLPVDRFVFGKGEPEVRHATKVNGLPYRPANLPWPRDCERLPMTFLVQFCFAESQDHMGDTPGAVLVVFMRTMKSLLGSFGPLVDPYEDINSLVFEWYPLGLGNLVRKDKVPEATVLFPTCFGVRHRSLDYADDEGLVRALGEVVSPESRGGRTARPSASERFFRQATLRALCCHPRMKIGGKPFWYKPESATVKGRFLGSFWGVDPVSELPYPWVNDSEPLSSHQKLSDENFLIFRDGCCINLFLQDDGTIDWDAQFL